MTDLLSNSSFLQIVEGRRGRFVVNRNDTFIGRALIAFGEHQEAIARLFDQLLRPGDIAIDAGANIGAFTIPMAKRVGKSSRVIAFEPQQFVFQMLCTNVVLNELTNVDAYPEALGERADRLCLGHINYEAAEVNFGGVSTEDFLVQNNGTRTNLTRLDDAIDYSRIRLIKIDVEGHESKVLQGARELIAQTRPVLYVENDRIEASPALIQQVLDMDYKAFWRCLRYYNPDNYFGREDIFEPGLTSFDMLCFPNGMEHPLMGTEESTDPTDHPFLR